MSFFNQPDFFTIRELDVENKLILPTKTLYNQTTFQLNSLYQDISSALINAHDIVAIHTKQLYLNPTKTLSVWYDQATAMSTAYYTQAQAVVLPVYENWQAKLNTSKEKVIQNFQVFWDNPEQVTVATFQPLAQYVTDATKQSSQYLKLFMDNPEQFLSSAFAPVTYYLSSLSDDAEAILISSYYALADLSKLLLEQPSATIQSIYHNALSALLDTYFDIISSLLVTI
jgi:hypothetical protein